MKLFLYFLLLSKLLNSQDIIGTYVKDSISLVYTNAIKSIKPEVKILGLGEQWHGDGTTFSIKSDLIKLLSKSKNAVLFSESSAFGCLKGLEIGLFNDTLNMGISDVWSKTKDFEPLMKSLQDKEIEYAGIDVQIYDSYANYYLCDYIKNILLNKNILTDNELKNLLATTDSIIKLRYKYKFNTRKLIEWNSTFNKISINEKLFSTKEYYILFNLKNFGLLVNIYDNNSRNFTVGNRYRDSLMALNCTYLITNMYPDRFVVISAASFHLIKNHILDYPSSDKNIKTLGDFLAEKYDEKYSVMIFTSSLGTHAMYNTIRLENVPKPKKNSIEKILYDAKYEFAFIDLIKFNKILPIKYFMPYGYEYLKINNPLIHFNSIFYVREMHRTQPCISSTKN